MQKSKQQVIADVADCRRFHTRLFEIANSYAGEENGDIAVALHGCCNRLQDQIEIMVKRFLS